MFVSRSGVGAPIPSGTSIASRDAVKLKGKLAGKKRGREDEDVKQDAPLDDEQESKASAVKKKARHDPFAPKVKKKASVAPPSGSEEPVAPSSPKASISPVKQSVDEDSPSPRKKKKKHHRPADIQDDAVTTAKSPDNSQKATEVVKSSHKTHSSPSSMLMTLSPSLFVDRSPETGSSPQDSPLVTAKLPSAPPTSPAKSSAQDMPLLNLDGPPPVVDGSPSKRKRKRNKKKKRKTSGQTPDAPEADPDDDASS